MKYVLFFLISVYIGVVFADAGQYQQRAVLEEPEQLIQTDTALELQPQRSIQAYQNVISELESVHGAYDSRIGEALLSIGKLYQARGRHKDAVNYLYRALHISKVSGGLYNLAQIGIIDLIIDSNTELQDWEELEENYHYQYWVYRRNYGDDDARIIPIIDKIGRGLIQSYESNPGGQTLGNLVKAEDLYDKAVKIIANKFGDKDPQLVDTLYYTAVINYYIATDVTDFKVSYRQIRESMLSNGRPMPFVDEELARNDLFDRSFFKGKMAIERIIEIAAQTKPYSASEHAKAVAYLGDWNLIFRRKWNAHRIYRQAYDILTRGGGNIDEIQALFGKPKPLRTLTLPGTEDLVVIDDTAYVDAIFNVPSSGWPRDIRIIKTNPADDPKMLQWGKLAIAATRYRPRFEGGKPVNTTSVSLRYAFK